nr:MAG TPA: hypothetical protein [Caudoviricetes sp.]
MNQVWETDLHQLFFLIIIFCTNRRAVDLPDYFSLFISSTSSQVYHLLLQPLS